MSKNKSYDVFISYRREGGLDFARSIAYYLRIEGLQCFFDQRELKTGQFNQQIYTAIDNSKYFLAVITPGSLERCANENDWVRNEIEHAIEQGLTIIPVAVRGEKLSFPENLPESMSKLKTAQASFIDRETDFEETIIKMLRDQMTNLSETTDRQRRKSKSQAEKVFVKKTWRFKNNDGVIDGDERVELERLASASGISRNRLEELVEGVEASAARKARIVAWFKQRPRITISVLGGVAVAALAFLGLLLSTVCHPVIPGDGGSRTNGESVADEGGAVVTEKGMSPPKNETEKAREVLQGCGSVVRKVAEADLYNILTRRAMRGPNLMRQKNVVNTSVRWIEEEYESLTDEGRKLYELGMSPSEIEKSRPDLVLRLVKMRVKIAAQIKKMVEEDKHEAALVYYNAAKKLFERLGMMDLDRPSFSRK